MAKLLVHGGVSFSERKRIPESGWQWYVDSEFAPLVNRLEDVQAGSPFGLGARGETPFLLFRRLVPSGERKYPLTVILCPDGRQWEKCGWNAAALAAALSTSNGPGDEIVHRPEGIDSARLEEVVGALTSLAQQHRAQSQGVDALAERLRNIWVGASLRPDPVRLPLEVLRLGEYPTAAVVAPWIEALPVCFRAGRGWLLGSTKFIAEAIGVQLFIGETIVPDAETIVADLEREGAAILAAWRDLHSDPEVAARIEPLAEEPSLLAPDAETASFFRFLRLYALACAEDTWGANADALVKEEFDRSRLLGSFVLRALEDLNHRTQGPLGKEATRYYLRRWQAGSHPIPADLAQRLNEDVLVEELVKLGYPVAVQQGLPPLSVPDAIHKRLWMDALDRSPVEELPQLLARAFEEVPALGVPELARRSVARWKETRASFRPWVGLVDHPMAPESLRNELQAAVQERVRIAPRHWEYWIDDYVRFGGDPGGMVLLDRYRGAIGKIALTLLQRNDPAGLDWLRAMASTRHSSALRLNELMELARVGGTWSALALVKAISDGKHPEKLGLQRVQLSPPDLEIVWRVVGEMLQRCPTSQKPRRMAVIQEYIQPLHSETTTQTAAVPGPVALPQWVLPATDGYSQDRPLQGEPDTNTNSGNPDRPEGPWGWLRGFFRGSDR